MSGAGFAAALEDLGADVAALLGPLVGLLGQHRPDHLLMGLKESADQITFLIRHRDILYPTAFEHVLSDAGIRTVRSAARAPQMNAIMERWIGGCRRELLDRTLIGNLPHLRRVLRACGIHHNEHRPHTALASAALQGEHYCAAGRATTRP